MTKKIIALALTVSLLSIGSALAAPPPPPKPPKPMTGQIDVICKMVVKDAKGHVIGQRTYKDHRRGVVGNMKASHLVGAEGMCGWVDC
jgi:hypothetical protein